MRVCVGGVFFPPFRRHCSAKMSRRAVFSEGKFRVIQPPPSPETIFYSRRRRRRRVDVSQYGSDRSRRVKEGGRVGSCGLNKGPSFCRRGEGGKTIRTQIRPGRSPRPQSAFFAPGDSRKVDVFIVWEKISARESCKLSVPRHTPSKVISGSAGFSF